MPTTLLTANMVVQWAMSKTNTPFAPTKQGMDGVEYNLHDLNPVFDRVYAASIPLGASAVTTLDLSALNDLLVQPINFTKVLFAFILAQGSDVKIEPGATNGLQLFGGAARAVDVLKNGALFYGGDPAGAGLTVDATHKTLKLTNLTVTPATVEIVIAGDG